MEKVLIVILIISLIILFVFFIRTKGKLTKKIKKTEDELQLLRPYKDIPDIKAEISALKREAETEIATLTREKRELTESYNDESEQLEEKINKYKKESEHLKSLIDAYTEEAEIIEFGIYHNEYIFDSSEKYKLKHKMIEEELKYLIKNKKAVICTTTWTIGDSVKEGEKVVNNIIKLALRAFNGESDVLIAKVKYNNITLYIKRIKKSAEIINKLIKGFHCYITDEYIDWKIEELKIAFEYQEKLFEEKEEQRRIKEEMREEEKARKEFEREKKKAIEEEKRYQKALEEAKDKLKDLKGEELAILNEQIAKLQEQLEEAQQKERTISQAELTKTGHVYIISNIGSFGDNIYKIGMTRRLEPTDRVKELGDASVPFSFDIHAMIHSENAPELEKKLHQIFDHKRLNRVNYRKEFFNISLEEIESAVRANHREIEFTKIADAKEYRETLEIIKEEQEN